MTQDVSNLIEAVETLLSEIDNSFAGERGAYKANMEAVRRRVNEVRGTGLTGFDNEDSARLRARCSIEENDPTTHSFSR